MPRKNASSGDSYFVDHKRGEVMELRGHLRNPKLNRDPEQKREVLKKVIAYMTLGIDVSTLFSDMVMATTTSDLVQKKMVYLFLCTYASMKQDLSLLAVNTLQRDCRDDDPMVRGLALRSLCSLRVENLVEYIVTPIRTGLTDASPYVRKIAVMGVAKLFTVSPPLVKESDLVDILYNMLKDNDSQVVTNVIHALNEILVDEGGMAVNRQIIHHLLNRLHSFNEWGQIAILQVTAKYRPSGSNAKEETFDIMNLLEDRLRHSNSALVLAVTKVFLNITEKMSTVHRQVYERIKVPLLTLSESANSSVGYPVLAHIALMTKKNANVFADSFKHFFCRYNDPLCVKQLKVEILSDIANDTNALEILDELAEYVTDVHIEIARLSIQSIGRVVVKCEDALDQGISHLMSFLDMSTDYILGETCVCVKNILRKYPDKYEEILSNLKSIMRQVEEKNGKCSVVWLLGEYGECFAEAPYILENLIEGFDMEESSEVRLEMLSATMKLFFKRPPEVHSMLGRLLSTAIEDTSRVDVRDRAVFYYKLLREDVIEAARVVNCPKIIVDAFAEEVDDEMLGRVFAEFNSLAVVYKKPSELFVNLVEFDEEDEDEDDEDDDEEDGDGGENENGGIADDFDDLGGGNHMLDDDAKELGDDNVGNGGGGIEIDFFGGGMGSMASSAPSVALRADPHCEQTMFEAAWGSLPALPLIERNVASRQVVMTQLEPALRAAHLKIMASGNVGNTVKFYLYGQESPPKEALHFIECIVDLDALTLKATVKGPTETVEGVKKIFEETISGIVTQG